MSEGSLLLNLQTVQSGALRTVIEVLKDVLNDINIVFDPNGMKIVSMDGSHSALVSMHLFADRFETYYCPTKINVGISIASLHKLMKTISNSDTVTFKIYEKNTNELHLCIQNADRNCSTTFKLKLLDIDTSEIEVKETDINCIVTMPSNDFQRLCREMSNISDIVNITCDNKTLTFSCEGDFANQETIIGEATHGLIFNKYDIQHKISENFALKYINLFTKSTNLCNTIEINLKSQYPLILKYNVANLGEIRFALAPKV